MAKKTKGMRAGGGREKGAEFEKLICKKLSLWVTDHTRTDVFWRAPGSGSRATRLGVDASKHAGDIVATGADACAFLDRFYVECKHYKELLLDAFVFGDVGHRQILWDKPCAEAAEHGRLPFVIAKQNRKPELVLLSLEGLTLLQAPPCGSAIDVRAIFPELGVYIVHLVDILCNVPYGVLRAKAPMVKRTVTSRRVRRKPPPR